jgi:hypothetical protein
MEVVKPFSLRLPKGQPVDVVILRDEAGNIIVRSAEEVSQHPLRAALEVTAKAGGGK